MKKIAVTGGLSSGKSSVCQLLKEKGAYVVSADAVVHELLSLRTALGSQIVKLLGKEIVKEGKLDKAEIATRAFRDKETLKALEQILHPAALKEIEERYHQIKDQNSYPLFVAEIPLLYETDYAKAFDLVVVVDSNPQVAKKRFERKFGGENTYEARMGNQFSQEHKRALADYVLDNNGDFTDLAKQVDRLYETLTNQE